MPEVIHDPNTESRSLSHQKGVAEDYQLNQAFGDCIEGLSPSQLACSDVSIDPELEAYSLDFSAIPICFLDTPSTKPTHPSIPIRRFDKMKCLRLAERLLPVALLPLLFAACSPTGPTISQASPRANPNPSVPLAAILSVSADQPVTLTINIDDGERQWSITPSHESSTQFEVPVIGMRGRSHSITATLTNARGNSTTSDPMTFETPAIPDTFPVPKVTTRNPDAMEPGVTLFTVNGRWDAEGNSTPANFMS